MSSTREMGDPRISWTAWIIASPAWEHSLPLTSSVSEEVPKSTRFAVAIQPGSGCRVLTGARNGPLALNFLPAGVPGAGGAGPIAVLRGLGCGREPAR
jgi:hypothetical protein